MHLKQIDKPRYSRHYKIVFTSMAVALLVITVAASSLIIHLFGSDGESHFWFNVIGVIIAAATIFYTLTKLRHHPFMIEVVYVWDLKQVLNKIYRKQRHIEKKIEEGDQDAMVIMNYQYRGSKQLYQLDDNTLTLTDLNSKIKQLDIRMSAAGLSSSTDVFDIGMLDQF